MDDDQLVEQKEEFQPFDYTLFLIVNVEKEYTSENVVNNAALELRYLGSHSKHFSTLCLDYDMKFESSKLMNECIDEGKGPTS
ncbi:hypothetical protein H5410_015802 [Solanum commersonii]|uniref:Uncharacterized protein n=1 Tax=Solanum commersonii TaxID=4109 RepID=A0A9J5ZVH3_SOLCO|nr:hypothetical protein H5410_015802 [Solanum commersonii]